MIPYIIAFFVGVLCGYVVCALVSGGETEGESYWRTQYFILKDKGESYWRTQYFILKDKGESYWRTQYFILKDKGVNNEN